MKIKVFLFNLDSIDEMVIDQPQHDLKPTGKVVGIIKRNWRPYCGTIEAPMNIPSNSQSVTVNFWPFDKKIPKIRIRTRQLANLLNKRIVVSIDNWSDTSKNPSGHFVKILGDVGDKMTETQLLLLEFDVSYTKFSDSVDACLPKEGDKWVVDEDRDLAGRKDLRDLNVCSIGKL